MRQDEGVARNRGGVEEEIDQLFTLDPAAFVASRDELTRRLKATGRSEEAAEIRGLRRPTVAAWAVNQAVRRLPADIEELLAAGAGLRAAQRKALSGVGAGGFREAMDRRRRVVGKLARAAEQVLKESGHGSPGATEAVVATFEAASLDEEAAELVRAGRLSKEIPAPSGFGGVGGLGLVQVTRSERPTAAPGKEEEEAPTRKAAQREAKELANQAAEAHRRAIRARADADRAKERAERLRQEAEGAMAQAKEAADAARTAKTEADRAQAEAERASRKV